MSRQTKDLNQYKLLNSIINKLIEKNKMIKN